MLGTKQQKRKLEPLQDRLIVRRIEEGEQTRGGIYIPDAAKEKPQEGEIVAVGVGRILDSGVQVKSTLSVGDRILFSKYGGSEVEIDGEKLLIMREDDVLVRIS